MNSKIATILVLLMCMLNLVPPLFKDGVYFDNIYYSILYLLLSFLAISIPFLVPIINKHIMRISFLIGGWFIFGLIFELINFFIPKIVLNSKSDSFVFAKMLIVFIIGLAFSITFEQWKLTKSER